MDKLVIQQLNPIYFWDIDFEKLDLIKNKRIIIERIINFGNSTDLKLILSLYGKPEIIKTLCKLNFLDDKTLNLYSLFFDVPKSKFKCYTKKQLTTQLWS